MNSLLFFLSLISRACGLQFADWGFTACARVTRLTKRKITVINAIKNVVIVNRSVCTISD